MLPRYLSVKKLSGQILSTIQSRDVTQKIYNKRCHSDCVTNSKSFPGQQLPLQGLTNHCCIFLSSRKPGDCLAGPYLSETARGLLNNSMNMTNDMIMRLDNSKGNCNQPQTPKNNDSCKPKKNECDQEQEEYNITPCCRPFRLQKDHPMKDTCKKKNKKC